MFAGVTALVVLILAPLGAEIAAQVYVRSIALKGKRFRPDARTGWAVLPDLDLVRVNADGERYRLVTDEQGQRPLPDRWASEQVRTRLTILGDSFAFGEGVDLEARFDSVLLQRFPKLAIQNLGVPGFGFDQEWVLGLQRLSGARRGDRFLFLSYGNDFLDVLRQRFAGRSKPWFRSAEGAFVLQPPEISAFGHLRDRSCLVAFAGRLFEEVRAAPSPEDMEWSWRLYEYLLTDFQRRAKQRGCEVWIAHHGDTIYPFSFELAARYSGLERAGLHVVSLDRSLVGAREAYLADGHWSRRGHQLVANVLAKVPGLLAASSAAD